MKKHIADSFPRETDEGLEVAIRYVHQQLLPEGLTHVQENVLRQCWFGETYQMIAETYGYDDNYIRAVGSQLWQQLSTLIGYKVTKNNFRLALNTLISQHNSPTTSVLGTAAATNRKGITLRQPAKLAPSNEQGTYGQGALGSNTFYIERAEIEASCYEGILQPGALVRLKAPKQMGKTSLMTRVVKQVQEQGYATVTLNLELATPQLLSDTDRFLRWFCLMVGKGLGLPNQIDSYWEEMCGGSYNCTEYFEAYLLAQLTQPVVLSLDNVDVVFSYPETATSFFSMLRAWFESARYAGTTSELWKQLRLVVVYSTEVYLPFSVHQSPFNVGTFIELPPFSIEQIAMLAEQYELNLSEQQIKRLLAWVGGNPYLVQLTLQACRYTELKQLLCPDSIDGVYSEHLQRQFWALQPYPTLKTALAQVIAASTPVTLEAATMFKLEGMGLIRIWQRRAVPACELYQAYFSDILEMH